MECYVITAILNGEQRVREEDYLRRQMARDSGMAYAARGAPWQAIVVLLGGKGGVTRDRRSRRQRARLVNLLPGQSG